MLRKITALVLSAATAVCAYNANVMAYDTDGDNLSLNVSAAENAETSNTTKVCVWFKNDDYSSSAWEQASVMASEYEDTLDRTEYTPNEIERLRTDYYTAKARELLKAENLERAYQILDELGIDRKNAFCSSYAPMIVCELTSEQIKTAEAMEYVSEISIYEPLENAEDATHPPTELPWINNPEDIVATDNDDLSKTTEIPETVPPDCMEPEPYTEFTTDLDKGTSELSFYIKSLPDKTVYNIGEELDLTGGVYDVYETVTFPDGNKMYADLFNIEMTDGSKTMNGFAPIDVNLDTSEFDSTKAGVYHVYITVSNASTGFSKDFTVTVKDPDAEPVTMVTEIPATENKIITHASTQFTAEIESIGVGWVNFEGIGTFSFTDSNNYYGGNETFNLENYKNGDVVNISFEYSTGYSGIYDRIEKINSLELIDNVRVTTTAIENINTVTTTQETAAVSEEPVSDILGDANGDFKISISDSVKILQYLANTEKYPLTAQQKINADCYNIGDGITGMDAQLIQKYDAGDFDALLEKNGVLPDPEFEAIDTEARITIKSYPDKLTYNVGEELDLTGGVYDVHVTVKPDNSMEYTSQQTGDMSDLRIYDGSYTVGAPSYVDISIDTSAFDNTKAGIYQIVIRVDSESGRTCVPFEVEVK